MFLNGEYFSIMKWRDRIFCSSPRADSKCVTCPLAGAARTAGRLSLHPPGLSRADLRHQGNAGAWRREAPHLCALITLLDGPGFHDNAVASYFRRTSNRSARAASTWILHRFSTRPFRRIESLCTIVDLASQQGNFPISQMRGWIFSNLIREEAHRYREDNCL
jgi:hypothetical protein